MALAARRVAWVRSMHGAAARVLVRRGYDLVTAWWCALALVCHWVRETGWGDSMHGNNPGNIRAGAGWTGPTVTQQGSDDPEGGAPYRAYDTPEDGAAAAMVLAIDGGRYRAAWAALVASCGRGPYQVGDASIGCDAPAWYAALMHAGWHPYSDRSLADYRGVVVMVASIVGGPPVGAPLAVGLVASAALLGGLKFAEWWWGW